MSFSKITISHTKYYLISGKNDRNSGISGMTGMEEMSRMLRRESKGTVLILHYEASIPLITQCFTPKSKNPGAGSYVGAV